MAAWVAVNLNTLQVYSQSLQNTPLLADRITVLDSGTHGTRQPLRTIVAWSGQPWWMPVGNENTAVRGGLAGRPQRRQSQRNWQHYPLRLDRPWWKPV
eukprot:2663542-Amphidinium_carterae.1